MTHQYMELKIEELEKRIKSLEQQSCDNASTRKDTLKTLQSKTGHWIYDETYSDWYYTDYKCSCCKRVISIPHERRNEVYKEYPYCHCGAKMIEPQESEEQVMIYTYTFEDGTVLTLLNVGLSAAEVRKLEELHGKCRRIESGNKE